MSIFIPWPLLYGERSRLLYRPDSTTRDRGDAAAGGKMKRFGALLLSLCLFGAAGCGDDDSTSPSNLPIVMTASLTPAIEVPAIANAENTGQGAVQITLNVTRDGSGAISGGTAEFDFQLSGFP